MMYLTGTIVLHFPFIKSVVCWEQLFFHSFYDTIYADNGQQGVGIGRWVSLSVFEWRWPFLWS